MPAFRLLPAGEQGLVVEFGDQIDQTMNACVHRLKRLLTGLNPPGLLETVPTYRSLLVYFDPVVISRGTLSGHIECLLSSTGEADVTQETARLIAIPVCYGGEYGPDLAFVAQHNGLAVDEVVAIHTSTPYLVYMLGFTPGFPYLGGMSPRIATPRLTTPRTQIPAGSVGIAGSQTGFYPIASPGGWQLIGRTPVKAFDPAAEKPFAFAAGDYLQFVSITTGEYEVVASQVAAGTYQYAAKPYRSGGDQA